MDKIKVKVRFFFSIQKVFGVRGSRNLIWNLDDKCGKGVISFYYKFLFVMRVRVL